MGPGPAAYNVLKKQGKRKTRVVREEIRVKLGDVKDEDIRLVLTDATNKRKDLIADQQSREHSKEQEQSSQKK